MMENLLQAVLLEDDEPTEFNLESYGITAGGDVLTVYLRNSFLVGNTLNIGYGCKQNFLMDLKITGMLRKWDYSQSKYRSRL